MREAMKTIMNVLSNNTVCLQYIYDSFILRHLQFHFAGHWELGGTWTARNGNYCDPEAWSFYKQQPKEHWNCHRGRGSHHRTWRYCEGLLCPPWLDLRTESRLSQTAEVHLWGIPKTFLGTGWFKTVKQSPVPQEQTSGLKWDCSCSADFCATQCPASTELENCTFESALFVSWHWFGLCPTNVSDISIVSSKYKVQMFLLCTNCTFIIYVLAHALMENFYFKIIIDLI